MNSPRVWPFGPTRRGETYTAPFGAPISYPLTHSLSRWDYSMGYTYTAPVGAQGKFFCSSLQESASVSAAMGMK